MKLLIISHTPHYQVGQEVFGWGSTIREVDWLARLFDRVVHLAPLHPGQAPASSLPYTRPNVRFAAVQPAGGNRLIDKLGILARIPAWLGAMKREIKQADAVHIRCPAGISAVGLLAARLWAQGKPVWVKYAGNWQAQREPKSYTIQRWWLTRNLHKGAVTVNGSWPQQPAHVTSFNNPSYSLLDYQQARKLAEGKSIQEPVRILFVGRIEAAKGAGRVIDIAKSLKQQGLDFNLILIGDGPERNKFEEIVHREGLAGYIKFTGWINKEQIGVYYQTAHFIIHPSTASEGWPKVLSEAMAYGVVPLASTVSSIPQILAETGAGLAIPPGDHEAYAAAIIKYTQDGQAWQRASRKGIAAGKFFTYENYLAEVQALFQEHWQMDLNHG